MLVTFVLFSLLSVETLCSEPLITFPRSRMKSAEACCIDNHLKNCLNIGIKPELLEENEDFNILGIELKFSNTVPPFGHTYKSDKGDEAVISYNPKTKNMFGNLQTADGKYYGIEKCNQFHVFKEYDVPSFVQEKAVKIESPTIKNVDTKSVDNTTVVTYSVMFYYTPEFSATTSDIPGFIDQVIAESNQGYINSNIPVRISRFCIEQATLNDIADAGDMLTEFAQMKGSSSALRNTADAAALLVNDFNSCGIAYLGTFTSGWTVSVTGKSCALGYYSFGHEVGHNFGSHHNPEADTNTQWTYGHAHLIAQGSASAGRRTILAYNAN